MTPGYTVDPQTNELVPIGGPSIETLLTATDGLYVRKAGSQTISSPWNFTGGLTDNGSGLVKKNELVFDARYSGAAGTGLVNDTVPLQSALNGLSALGGGILRGRAGDVYLVAQAATKTFQTPSGSTTTLGYCLEVPSNVVFDLNGATLKLTAANDSFLVCNKTVNGTTDKELGIINGTLDGNNVAITSKALLGLVNVTRPKLLNLRFINTVHLAVQTYGCSNGNYDQLEAVAVVGNAFMFGQPYANAYETDSRFGRLYAKSCTVDPASPSNFPGNSVYGVFKNCTIDTIYAANCAAGVKIDRPTDTLAIGKVIVLNAGEGDTNSGLKIQGDGSGVVSRVTVGEVISRGCAGSGLYIEANTEDISVGVYEGHGNASLGTSPCVWLAGKRNQIGLVKSRNSGGSGVLVRTDALNYSLGDLMISNTGIVGSSKQGVSVNGGSGVIGSVTAVDDQGVPTMNRAVDVNGSAAVLDIGPIRSTGHTDKPFQAAAGSKVTLRQPMIQAKNAAYTVLPSDGTILATGGSGGITVTLPATPVAGQTHTVKKVDAGVGVITVTPSSGTIDGAANDTISTQWSSVTYTSDGSAWFKT